MVFFIITSIIVLISLGLLVYDYLYIKNEAINIDLRIKRFIFGGIEILLAGILLVALPIIGSKVNEMQINIETYLLFILVLIAILVYLGLIFLWSMFFKYFEKYFKKVVNPKYRFKSISIYGLIYSFGIMFYLIYTIIFF